MGTWKRCGAAKELVRSGFFRACCLMTFVGEQFLPFVREKFPRLARQYEQW